MAGPAPRRVWQPAGAGLRCRRGSRLGWRPRPRLRHHAALREQRRARPCSPAPARVACSQRARASVLLRRLHACAGRTLLRGARNEMLRPRPHPAPPRPRPQYPACAHAGRTGTAASRYPSCGTSPARRWWRWTTCIGSAISCTLVGGKAGVGGSHSRDTLRTAQNRGKPTL